MNTTNNSERSIFSLLTLALMLVVLTPGLALAHSEEVEAMGFINGLTHPVFGLDHLLAMLSVGIVSALYGRFWVWIIPAIFVGLMVIGGIVGALGIGAPHVELGIALSVVVLGAAICLANNAQYQRWLISSSVVFVVIFGFFHGHAHGEEMPGAASPIFYTLGFVLTTCLIHLLGVFIGHWSTKDLLKRATPILGGAITFAGLYILLG